MVGYRGKERLMREKELIKECIKEAGWTYRMLGECLGDKHQNVARNMIERSSSMLVNNFVKMLDSMGYTVKVVGFGKEWELEPSDIGRKKWERKAEAKNFCEEQKGEEKPYKMINGRKVVEVAKGVWRYE